MMDKQTTVTFDRSKLAQLEWAYAQAVEANEEQFTFQGSKYSTAYAKYLIEYLQGMKL